ncbi:MAG: tetratricopeptide repeat protein [candidate division WOR-3 bacterium]|nr:MAG: tetratricopeptide repeat protein [candidate division WOR-3 bacterium]
MFLVIAVVGLIATIIFGFLQVVIPFLRGEVKFSKRFPFITNVRPTTSKDTELRPESKGELSAPREKQEPARIDLHVSAEGHEAVKSIAVLPFTDISPQKDQEYFCDGVSEELINALTKVEDLRVVARTSAFAFKGKTEDIREIGKKLNVKTVLEGSVRKAGNNLRITAQLINVDDGYHLWSERYDRQMEDIFTIQDEISQAIVETLKLKLLGEEEAILVKHHTENLEAYNFYLKGRYYWNKRTGESLQRGIEYFEQAIKKDPGYALAYSGLADCYILLPWYSGLPPKKVVAKAKESAIKALELNDTLAEAHTSLAYAMTTHEWDWSGAEREFKRSFGLNPTYATAHQWYAEYLLYLGRLDEAIAEVERALECDPLSLVINSLMGWLLYAERRYDQAIEQFKKTLELDPNFYVANLVIGMTYVQKEMFEEAKKSFQKAKVLSGGATMADALLGHAFALVGKKKEARKVLDELKREAKRMYIPPLDIAVVYVGLNEKDLAFEWLEKAFEERSIWMIILRVDPIFDNVRSDSRLQDLLRRIYFSDTCHHQNIHWT